MNNGNMDTALPQNNSSQNPEVPRQASTEQQNKQKHSRKPFVLIILFLVITITTAGILLKQSKSQLQQNITTAPTAVIQKDNSSNSYITSQQEGVPVPTVTKDQSLYVNKDYGFAMVYPKLDQSGDSCTQNSDGSYSGIVPYKVFEDLSLNSIYIAQAIYAEKPEKFIPQERGYTWDPATCKIVNNSLDLIKNGYANGIPGSNDKPEAFQIKYAKINNEDDLNNLVHSMYGKGCYAKRSGQDKVLPETYDYTIADNNGNINPWPGNPTPTGYKEPLNGGCLVNFGLLFFYSPSKKLAILSQGFQNGPLGGTNGQYAPTFTILP